MAKAVWSTLLLLGSLTEMVGAQAPPEADQRLNAGVQDQANPVKEVRLRALDDCQFAVREFHKLGRKSDEAKALACAGNIYRSIDRLNEAYTHLTAALKLAREASGRDAERDTEARALTNLGAVEWRQSDFETAQSHLEQAGQIWRALGNRKGELTVKANLCGVLASRGKSEEAVQCFEETRPLVREFGEKRAEAALVLNIASTLFNAGDRSRARTYAEEARSVASAAGDRPVEARAIDELARIYLNEGQPQTALDFSRAALRIHEAIHDDRGTAETWQSLGDQLMTLGDFDSAIDYFQRGLQLEEKIGNVPKTSEIWGDLGDAYSAAGQKAKAEQAFGKAVETAKASGDERRLGGAYARLGDHFVDSGDLSTAERYYREALPRLERIGATLPQAAALRGLGAALQSKPHEARPLLQKSLALYEKSGTAASSQETLYELARLEARAGNTPEALIFLDKAISLIESARATIRSQETRASFLGVSSRIYALRQQILVGAKRLGEAFEMAERSRARSLLDILDERQLHGALPEDLRRRVQAKQTALSGKLKEMTLLLRGPHQDQEIAAIERTIRDLQRDYTELEGEIKTANPRLAELTQDQTLDRPGIQRLLGSGTVLLEYSLGEDRSYVWLVSSTELSAFELPKRSAIELLAARAYQTLKGGGSESSAGVRELSRVLLAPLAGRLKGQRLAIAADGTLNFIPFAVLADPERPKQLLIEGHEIVTLPSASVLSSLRRANRAMPPKKLMAVLGDPVFEPSDPRLSNSGAEVRVPALGRFRLDRLPSSRREADAIYALAKQNGASDELLGFDANRDFLMSPAASEYRMIHIATHGLYNSSHPSTSGLVLSLVNRDGKPREGFLWVHELYGLRLNTDLVVLSGCETALGKDVRGEGVQGMTRGLMYSGATRVLASLWSVTDRATADLMTLFYQGILSDGLTPSAALRKAQLQMRAQPGMTPYQWASFSFQGDWEWPSERYSRRK